jgi:hypothetical protein
MASSSRSKRKASIEPITVDELMNAAGMSGFVSFLNVTPQDYGRIQTGAAPVQAPTVGQSPTVGETTTVGERPADGESPTVPQTPTEGVHATAGSPKPIARTIEPSGSVLPFPPRDGVRSFRDTETKETPTVVFRPTVVQSPTVVETTTVGDPYSSFTVPSPVPSPVRTTKETPTAPQTPTVLENPTVGVSKTFGRERIFRATTVQHGHSSGEQNLFQTMWSSPDARIESPDSRLLTAGYDALARMANLNEKSVRHAIRALLAKLAIEVAAAEKCDQRLGRTYRIFSYRKVLDRREAAGLIWVRKTRGVEFIAQPAISPTVGLSPQTPTVSVVQAPTETVVETPTPTVVETPTPISTSISTSFHAPSSSIIEALRSYAPASDDDVAIQLARECRLRAPDASDQEIVHFIRLKAQTPGIRLPLGFLLKAVPRCFEGESFRQFRREEDRRREATARERAAIMQVWREILDDPESTEELRREARKALAETRDRTAPD